MRALIFAAGRGERMGALTHATPKPLLRVGEHYLIEFAIGNCRQAGITDIVINVSYQRDQIMAALGSGSRFGVNITYSIEPERLETGGGIIQALPMLGSDPFIVMSSDIITDYPLQQLSPQLTRHAHLVLVKNPAYHPQGDFSLEDGLLSLPLASTFTFANIALFHPAFFAGSTPGHFRLTKLLMPAVQNKKVTGDVYQGLWYNVGTPTDLAEVNQRAQTDTTLRPFASSSSLTI